MAKGDKECSECGKDMWLGQDVCSRCGHDHNPVPTFE